MHYKTQLTPYELHSAMGSLPIQDALALRAYLHPNKTLFTFLDDYGKECGKLSYLDLWQRARGIAAHLRAEGKAGDRVMLFYPEGLEFIAAFFACLLSQRIAIPVTLPTRRRVDKCVKIALDSDATVALAPSSLIDELREVLNDTKAATLRWIATDTVPVPAERVRPQEIVSSLDTSRLAYLQYTSGSTSDPMGVMVTHQNVTDNVRMIRDSWELDHTTDAVFWQPHHHDMGLILGQILPIALGNHTVLMAPSTFVRQPSIWLRAISQYRATMAGGPNFAYDLACERYSAEKLDDIDLSCWGRALNGADIVRPTSLERFEEMHRRHGFNGEAFLPCYGLAEATLVVSGGPAVRKVSIEAVDHKILESEQRVVEPSDPARSRRIVGCGEPLWQAEVAIVNPETRKRCKAEEVGEIWVTGPLVTAGYWKNPAETETKLRARIAGEPGKKYLRTGDLGFQGQKDRQVYICGRLKDVIICEGRNIYPEDIEYSIIRSFDVPKSISCAVFSYEVNDRQYIVAAIEADRDLKRRLNHDQSGLEGSIRAAVSEEHGISLSDILFVPPTAMHKTTSGKVQRGMMRTLYLAGAMEILERRLVRAV